MYLSLSLYNCKGFDLGHTYLTGKQTDQIPNQIIEKFKTLIHEEYHKQ